MLAAGRQLVAERRRATSGVAETSTSDTPSRPTRKVTTDAGAWVNAAELKPVTVA